MNMKNYGLRREVKDDPFYSQETYNAFLLIALANERGGKDNVTVIVGRYS